MSNSPLATYTRISPNRTSPRNHAIDTITIHCIVGQWTAKQGCDYFATTDRECSANYIVGKDGSIGLSVDEADRSWCTSSRENDNRAITIEVASDTEHPYAVTDAAYAALINLVADICKRNGIKKLVWSTNKTDRINHVNGCNMTVHRDYANKACPGQYLYDRHGAIAAEVNSRLDALEGVTPSPNPVEQVLYRVQTGAFREKGNALALKAKLEAANYDTYLVKVEHLFKVQVGAFSDVAKAEILEGKLKTLGFDTYITTKSGTPVSDAAEDTLTEGDRVRMAKDALVWGKSYGFQSWVYSTDLYVREIDGECVTVSTQKTGAITGNVHKKYLTEI